MLTEEQPHLGQLPERSRLAPYLREDRLVARDGFVSWEGSRYGVDWKWVGATVRVSQRQGTVEIRASQERLAVHPRSQQPGQRFILPGQWEGLPKADGRPHKEALAVQVPVGEVERRSLEVYELPAVPGFVPVIWRHRQGPRSTPFGYWPVATVNSPLKSKESITSCCASPQRRPRH